MGCQTSLLKKKSKKTQEVTEVLGCQTSVKKEVIEVLGCQKTLLKKRSNRSSGLPDISAKKRSSVLLDISVKKGSKRSSGLPVTCTASANWNVTNNCPHEQTRVAAIFDPQGKKHGNTMKDWWTPNKTSDKAWQHSERLVKS